MLASITDAADWVAVAGVATDGKMGFVALWLSAPLEAGFWPEAVAPCRATDTVPSPEPDTGLFEAEDKAG